MSLGRIEQRRYLKPGDRPERLARMKVRHRSMLPDAIRQQYGAGRPPGRDVLAERKRLVYGNFHEAMSLRKSQQTFRGQAENVRTTNEDFALGKIGLEQDHVGIDPPAAAHRQERITKQIGVNGEP